MSRVDLGDIEHLVLLAILRLGRDAYGIPILDEVCARSGREVSRATVYVALKRLEQKGLVTSKLGDSTPERGGRAKRFFKLKPSGPQGAARVARDVPVAVARLRIGAGSRMMLISRGAPLARRPADREAILGDLLEDAE